MIGSSRRTRRGGVIRVAVLAFCAASAPSLSTPARAQTTQSSNQIISPAVVAFSQTRDNGDGTGSLELLVLWRGAPGWFLKGNSNSSTDSHGGFAQWRATHWMSYGDTALAIEFTSASKDFDPVSTTVKILGRDFVLSGTNVVLVDGADSGQPTVVDARHVDPRFSGPDAVAAVIKREPDRDR